jgi:hypothetical protein
MILYRSTNTLFSYACSSFSLSGITAGSFLSTGTLSYTGSTYSLVGYNSALTTTLMSLGGVNSIIGSTTANTLADTRIENNNFSFTTGVSYKHKGGTLTINGNISVTGTTATLTSPNYIGLGDTTITVPGTGSWAKVEP